MPRDTPNATAQSADLGNYLFPYQKAWLTDRSRFKIWEKSRRIGATYVQSLEDVLDCMQLDALPVWFSSADESAAREYILYCEKWAKMANAVGIAMDSEIIDEKSGISAYSLSFRNGSRIHAMSSNPKGFRSKGGKVVLDEFAWHKDQQQLWTAARPVVTWGHSLRILSTHNGKQSLFYKFLEDCKQGKLDWAVHHVTIQDAVAEGLADRITGTKLTKSQRQDWLAQLHAEFHTEEAWLQEYCCLPVDEASAFLTLEMILSCEAPETQIIRPLEHTTGNLYIGYDVARRKHLSVIYVSELQGPLLVTRHIYTLRNTPFSEQKQLLFDLLKHPRVRRCCIDASGLGMNLAEDAQAHFGRYKVEAVNFTSPVKEELATDLRIRFEDRNLLIPAGDDLRSDLHSIRRITTTAGNTRYDVSQNETDGHADRFWALALCAHASKNASDGLPNITSRHTCESVDLLARF